MKKISLISIVLVISLTVFCQNKVNKNPFVWNKLEIKDTIDINFCKAIKFNNAGIDRINNGDFYIAIADFDTAIYYQPLFAKAFANRSSAYYSVNNYSMALSDINKAMQLDSTEIAFYYIRGLANKDLEFISQAISDLEYFIQKQPKFAYAYTYLGICYGMSSNYSKAEEAFNKSIELDPNVAEFYYNRSVLYSNLKKIDLEISDLEQTIKFDSTFKSAFHNLGHICSIKGNCKKAIEYFTKTLQLDPNDIKSRFQRAMCFREIKEFGKVIDDLNFLIELRPNNSKLYEARIETYEEMGEKDKAEKDKKRLKELKN